MAVRLTLEFKAKDADGAVEKGDLVVVIDVLRCSTSIINALANGAEAVIPAETLKEAHGIRRKHPECLLAGERGGLKPRGFDFGNSPLEFQAERIKGKTLVFTTTSGTRALTRSKTAKYVLVGGLLNAGAVAYKALEIAESEGLGISLVLSGTKGRFSLEDFVCAGAIVESMPKERVDLSDAALAALAALRQMRGNLCENIIAGEHARNLLDLGFKADVEFSCQLNLLPIVPIYRDGAIRLLKGGLRVVD